MEKILLYAKILALPILIYSLFVFVKLTGSEPAVDLAGVHAVMGAVFLLYGLSVAYSVSLFRYSSHFSHHERINTNFWPLVSFLFLLLFCDATFAVHEGVASFFKIPESSVFLFYGGLLSLIVFRYVKSFRFVFWVLFFGFVLFSGLAVIGDSGANHEGVFQLGGNEYSYEQAFETFSTLLLAMAFASEAFFDFIEQIKKPAEAK